LKEIFVFGGPDGAGKTTMAARLLPRHLGVIEFGGDRMTELTRAASPRRVPTWKNVIAC